MLLRHLGTSYISRTRFFVSTKIPFIRHLVGQNRETEFDRNFDFCWIFCKHSAKQPDNWPTSHCLPLRQFLWVHGSWKMSNALYCPFIRHRHNLSRDYRSKYIFLQDSIDRRTPTEICWKPKLENWQNTWLHRRSVGVLSGSKARERFYLETI